MRTGFLSDLIEFSKVAFPGKKLFASLYFLAQLELSPSLTPNPLDAIENLVEDAQAAASFGFFGGEFVWQVSVAGTRGREPQTPIADSPGILSLGSGKLNDNRFTRI